MAETVFISGADKGLGLSLTRAFLQTGLRVFAGTFTGSDGLAGLAREFPQTLEVVALDVSDPESIAAAVRTVGEQTPGIDLLVNNAGVHIEKEASALEELDFSDGHLERTLTVNTFGPLRLVQQCLPLLKTGQRKVIVNISSEAGSIADCWRDREFAYCMSKAALNMQSRLLQNYLGPQGFKVLAIHPGWMRTDMGGPKADISADQAAQGIVDLTLKKWSAEDEIYIDYRGRPLHW